MRPFSLLIKPASGDCNLRCDYCFYTRKCALFPETPRHRMTDAVLERLVSSFLATPQPQHSFGWQGGEPTLMGLDFFKQVVALQQRHGKPGTTVANGLQTNATLIDDDFAHFLTEFRFLVGCSLDGPAELHDRYRRNFANHGSHAAVLHGIAALQRARTDFNILTLVSAANVAHARTVYRYLNDLGCRYHQYIPCVETAPDGALQPYTISASAWGDFLCALFDEWYAADTRRVSIRHFDAILAKLVDGQDAVCTLARNCCQYLVVEHNGNVYPCDFFVEPALQVGNIMTDDWAKLLEAPVYRAFGARKSRWHSACAACPYLGLCAGDCLKHRLPIGHQAPACSHLCAGWRQFFDHSLPRFETLAAAIRADRRAQAAALTIPPPKAGRNEPCPCGSHRKFKHCCGRA